MDISCLKTKFTMKLYNNTVPYLLFFMERFEYVIDTFSYLFEILGTLLLTIILGLSICLKYAIFHFWDAFMDFTKRKNKTKDGGIRYNLLFTHNDSIIGNIFLFNQIKSSTQMELMKNVNHMTCVLSGSFREYYLIEGLKTDTKWMCIRRNSGHFKHENSEQHYRIELAENINDKEPWILSLQIKHINWLHFFNYSSSQQSDVKANRFEVDDDYNAYSEDDVLETIDEEEEEEEEDNDKDNSDNYGKNIDYIVTDDDVENYLKLARGELVIDHIGEDYIELKEMNIIEEEKDVESEMDDDQDDFSVDE